MREAAGVPRRRARSLLVIIEVAGAVALVTVAGLMAESFVRLAHVGLGFDASHVIAATLRLPRGRYASDDELRAFAQQAIALRSVPGIATVAIADHLPGAEFSGNLTFSVPGHIASYDAFSAHFVDVSPTFFSALGMPLIAGRAFSDADDANTPPVMMVNDVLARRLWSDQDPIGRDLHVPGLGHDVRVVGVVPDVRMGPLQRSGENVVYFPFAQVPGTDVAVIARTAGDPRAVEASMAAAMHALDPQLPMPPIRPLADSLADTRALPRAETWWFVSFGGFALLLAALGVYGLLAFVVGRRTHEIGVRMALGANGRAIVTLVLREVCALGVLGVAAATAAAVAAGRFLQHVLFQTNASNPVMLVASTIVLAIVMGLAAYVPTYRAVHVDPTTALRSE